MSIYICTINHSVGMKHGEPSKGKRRDNCDQTTRTTQNLCYCCCCTFFTTFSSFFLLLDSPTETYTHSTSSSSSSSSWSFYLSRGSHKNQNKVTENYVHWNYTNHYHSFIEVGWFFLPLDQFCIMFGLSSFFCISFYFHHTFAALPYSTATQLLRMFLLLFYYYNCLSSTRRSIPYPRWQTHTHSHIYQYVWA